MLEMKWMYWSGVETTGKADLEARRVGSQVSTSMEEADGLVF